MLHNVDSIQDMIGAPKLSGVNHKGYQLLLSQAFMKEAEITRPWVAIGFNEWIQAARWWLMKAQSTLYSDTDQKLLPVQAFTDLLKVSFILVDIFHQHPQQRFWVTEYHEVELLADALRAELQKIQENGYQKPEWSAVQKSDLRLWEDAPPAVSMNLVPDGTDSAQSYS